MSPRIPRVRLGDYRQSASASPVSSLIHSAGEVSGAARGRRPARVCAAGPQTPVQPARALFLEGAWKPGGLRQDE